MKNVFFLDVRYTGSYVITLDKLIDVGVVWITLGGWWVGCRVVGEGSQSCLCSSAMAFN